MKKLIFSSLLLSTFMLGVYAHADEQNNSQDTEITTESVVKDDNYANELEQAENAGYTEEQFNAIMSIPNLEDVSSNQISSFSMASSMTSDQQKVVNEARKHLGKPYVLGAKGPNSFDCSGLVQYVYKNSVNMTVSAPTTTQEKLGKEVSLSALQPGDLLFYGSRGATYHVAIYSGNGNMIYAPQPGQKVKEAAVSGYKPDFAKRVLKENTNLVAGDVFYTTRIKGQGWTGESKNGTISGTIGKNTPLEALCVALKNGNVTGDVQYRTHVSNEGWLPWKANGRVSGEAGKRMEAFEIKLTGDMAKYYSIEYRSHVQDIGWTSWVKDGTTSGTTGKNKQVESVEIRLVKK